MKTTRTHFSVALVTLLLLGIEDHLRLARADWQIWTVVETRHVLRSDPPGDTHAVSLAVARNEWRSFQILLRADEAVAGVRVEPGALRGPGGAVIETSQARLFRQHQLPLKNGTYRNSQFKPDWYPDPLIPFTHPVTGTKLEGARITALPFDLPAGETHGFWIDLYVPENTAAGEYRGVYRVTAGPGRAVEVPVALTVWDFALPATPTLQTEFGSPVGGLRTFYQKQVKAGKESMPSDWTALEAQCNQLLSDNRLNAVPPGADLTPVAQPDGSFRIPAEKVNALRAFVDRYHVNALQTPHPSSVVKDPEPERDKLRAWLAAFDAAAKALDRPQVIFYTYLRDEPNTLEDYRYVQKWGRAVRAAKSVVKVLVVEQTWTAPGQEGADSAWGDLYGAVDIWCPLFSLHHQDSAAKRQALGELVWTYTALCQAQPTPWWHIDFPLLNYRVPAWMAWHDRLRGLLYWGGLSYWNQVDDPWVQAPYFTGNGLPQQGEKGIVYNGEGSLVYPAAAIGYAGIVPTIRLKALRDAVEDYEYLAILERRGKAAEADKIVTPLAGSFFQWEKNPAAFDAARAKLAALILSTANLK
jgi:hypothetical protein